MSYNILTVGHSAQSFIGDSNTTAQHDGSVVAARAPHRGHFVCPGSAPGPFAAPSLPLPAAGAEPAGAAPCARTQDRLHGQSPHKIDPGGSVTVPEASPAHQPLGGPSAGAMVGTKLRSWLRATSSVLSNASLNTVRIVTPQPSWPKCISYWRRFECTVQTN